jgi:hypothetical protein
VGGSARVWTGRLPERPLPGSAVELRLVMTKFSAPDVRVAYAIALG